MTSETIVIILISKMMIREARIWEDLRGGGRLHYLAGSARAERRGQPVCSTPPHRYNDDPHIQDVRKTFILNFSAEVTPRPAGPLKLLCVIVDHSGSVWVICARTAQSAPASCSYWSSSSSLPAKYIQMCSDADNGLVPLTKDITCNKIQPEGWTGLCCNTKVLQHDARCVIWWNSIYPRYPETQNSAKCAIMNILKTHNNAKYVESHRQSETQGWVKTQWYVQWIVSKAGSWF